MVGGEDEDIEDEAARDALLPAKLLALQRKTKQLLPWLDVSADCAWRVASRGGVIRLPIRASRQCDHERDRDRRATYLRKKPLDGSLGLVDETAPQRASVVKT